MVARSSSPIRLTAAFWLLVVSWACANVQPAALIGWISDVARFSHQQRLTLEVAALLAGDKPSPASATVAEATEPAEPTSVPVADGTFKKLEVPLPPPALVFAAMPAVEGRAREVPALVGVEPAAPPHGPPRVVRAS